MASGSHNPRPRRRERARHRRAAFTLIELLVVVAITGLLISILLPSLSAARRRAKAAKCLANLRTLGQGLSIYVTENRDVLMPSRLPKIRDKDCEPYALIYGRRKYRPTFVALMSRAVGVPPFEDPMACKTHCDSSGEPGDQQNYSYPGYVCPAIPDWTDERNGCYGYNYQFLGNSRLRDPADPHSFKNWPVQLTQIRHPGRTVAAGDCMGTAASWPPHERLEYDNNSRDAERFGNEGFNLDPPWVDPVNGEMANLDSNPQSRTAAHPRHSAKANILWVDGHGSAETLQTLGYGRRPDGSVGFEGENTQWTGTARNVPWTPEFKPGR